MYIDRGFIVWVYFLKYCVALTEAHNALVILKRPIPRFEIITFPTSFREAWSLRSSAHGGYNRLAYCDYATEISCIQC